MPNPRSAITTALIAGFVALGPLSTDMYLPALPSLTSHFSTSVDQVQLTLSVFLIGFAVAQLAYGPLSDRFGRRPVLFGGLALFGFASIGCMLASSIEQLIVFRLLQAIGGCAGPVVGRAMVRDIHGPRDSARVLSYLSTAMAVAPAVAPIIGGYMTVWWGWASVFAFLAAYALLSSGLLLSAIPETLPAGNLHSIRIGPMLRNYAVLIRHPSWRGYTLCCSMVYAGLFAFISGSSFVLIEVLDVAKQNFGLLFALMVAGYMASTLFAGRYSQRFGINRLLAAGSLMAALGGVIMAALALAEVHSVAAIVVPQILYAAGVGLVMPQAMAGALAPFPHMAGAASALLGFVQMTIAAGLGMLVGHWHDGTPRTMALAIGFAGIGTLLSWLLLIRRNAGSTKDD